MCQLLGDFVLYRPTTHTSLPPCYKILAAPLARDTPRSTKPTRDWHCGLAMGWALQGGQSPGRPLVRRGPDFQVKKIHNYLFCMGVLCTWVKLLTDLQMLGCELHKSGLSGQAPPGPAGASIALPQIPQPLLGEGRKGMGRKELGIFCSVKFS